MAIADLIERQREFFRTGRTKERDFRQEALRKLKSAVQRYEPELLRALKADLNKSEFDAYTTEIGIVLSEISHTLRHLKSWMKPRKVRTPLTHIGSKSVVYSEPYGISLIVAPWNYPFQLAVAPLIGAIAAGNCAVLKPSELTPRTSGLLARLIGETFPETYLAVVEGGVETSQELLNEPFDHIFFTGSVPVGRIVMEAASKRLTPVTLELGGKSPCIVHEDAKLDVAAKRVAWGKFMNAGQTCIAPDYLYVHRSVRDEFLRRLQSAVRELYGERPLENEHFTRIVSAKHFDRLNAFLDNGVVFMGGRADRDRLTIEPTVLTGVTWSDPVMQDEIFGPILPVLEYDRVDELAAGIEHHPKPLALYLFTESSDVTANVLDRVTFGGGCINDTVYHFTSPYLPFGGVGSSGTGAYHGKDSFDVFSHRKSVLKQTTLFDIPFRYPNFKNGLKYVKMFLK